PKRRDERQAAGEAGGDEESPQPVSVVVVMRPWGRLFVDGRERATGGRATMTLQAGSHRIEVRKGGRTVVDRRVEVSARHDEFEFETVD
ncbi:MAG: hypothetical protein ABEL76_16950, partial [Bradymonadaceae bacterium]